MNHVSLSVQHTEIEGQMLNAATALRARIVMATSTDSQVFARN